MKALSIQQPWSYCITHGTKRIENRTWRTSFRGPFLIHAGQAYQRGVEHEIHTDSPEMDVAAMRQAPRGGIVGAATLIDCINVQMTHDRIEPKQRIWTGSGFAFVLANVRAFPEIISYRGALGFFEVTGPVLEIALSYMKQDYDCLALTFSTRSTHGR